MRKSFARVTAIVAAVTVFFTIIPPKAANAIETYSGDIGKFPESYRAKLQALKSAHPAWSFEPLYTNLDWNEALTAEYDGDKCLIWAQAADILKSNAAGDYNGGAYVYKDSSHWVKTTKDVTAYFMDPRNWLNEENVFMFEDISMNGQTLSGVQSIIAGSFMDGAYADVAVKPEEETTTEAEKSTKRNANKTAQSKIEKMVRRNLTATEETTEKLQKETESVNETKEETTINEQEAVTDQTTIGETITMSATPESVESANSTTKSQNSKKNSEDNKIEYEYDEEDFEDFDDFDDWDEEEDSEDEETETTKKADQQQKGSITYAQAIYQAGVNANVNPYYLASKILQEVGRGGSDSVSGKHGDIVGIYNFYNIGASDSADPISNGLNWAKQSGDYGRPWTTPYKSIMGGAQYIADKFMSTGQRCGYLLRFNVNPNGAGGLYSHQYMTNIGGAAQESTAVRNTYVASGTLNTSKKFIIPVFENMPTETDEVDFSGDNTTGTIIDDCSLLESPGRESATVGSLKKGKKIQILEGVRSEDSYSFDSLNELYYYKVTYKSKGKSYTGYVPYYQVDMPVTAAVCKGYTYNLGSGKEYYYQSENSSVATVSEDGIVTMEGEGETRIFAFNGIKFQSIHVVCVPDTKENKAVGAIDVGDTQISMRCGEKTKITANCDVNWTNSNESVVHMDTDGTVTARKYGKAILKATYHDLITTVEVLVQPGKVEDFRAYLTSYDQLRLKWTPSEDAKGYVIYRRVKGHDYQLYATLEGDNRNTLVDKKVKEGEEYYYKIQSIASYGNGKYYSKPVVINAKALTGTPQAPQAIYTKDLKTHIPTKHIGNIISWTKVSGADGYVVYRKTEDEDYKEIMRIEQQEVEAYADTDVQTENVYTYMIRAYKIENVQSKKKKKTVQKIHYSEETPQLQVELPSYDKIIEER